MKNKEQKFEVGDLVEYESGLMGIVLEIWRPHPDGILLSMRQRGFCAVKISWANGAEEAVYLDSVKWNHTKVLSRA